ncbi:bifunctional DNA primase/polymerase (plasmid) [Actinacidiphila glaucinigra]|uniref:bifunctional DNA primase/polymerase n=1 Tax=Actinacidiphila glaucinigra TaxID=235986 RepID=UPI002DDC124B|nr:bifunctional DNA primase/polymerase [Actinacidiphila glaucinigra]WSD65735.1 bifunctional DNA primase/polymerase [Actinacidiphila glaucinigra]WSD65977.1 bifunctional DNA primase/polymerase [Actinacidiphila glaucinigra]
MLATTATPGREDPGRASPHSVARWCAEQGWYVHPLAPGLKVPPANCIHCRETIGGQPNPDHIPHTPQECRCIAAGRYCHGVRAATTDRALIDAWWGRNPHFGVGIAAGLSNLLIVDLDMHQSTPPDPERLLPGLTLPDDFDHTTIRSGMDVLALLCQLRRAPLLTDPPQTFSVCTPSGGLHLWYQVNDGSQWFMDSRGRLGWQIDIRADRSYAVAPGTRTRAGLYKPVGPCRTPAQLPRWLANDLARVGLKRRPHARAGHLGVSLPKSAGGRGYVASAVRAELEAVAGSSQGSRNDQLNASAFALGQFVGAGRLDRAEVHQALTDAAQAAGIDPAERKAQDTIRRGIEAGSRRPRQIGARA